jgi:hypothetical protein
MVFWYWSASALKAVLSVAGSSVQLPSSAVALLLVSLLAAACVHGRYQKTIRALGLGSVVGCRCWVCACVSLSALFNDLNGLCQLGLLCRLCRQQL